MMSRLRPNTIRSNFFAVVTNCGACRIMSSTVGMRSTEKEKREII